MPETPPKDVHQQTTITEKYTRQKPEIELEGEKEGFKSRLCINKKTLTTISMGNLCTKQTYHICSLLVLTIVSFTVIITLCYLVIKGTLASHYLLNQTNVKTI